MDLSTTRETSGAPPPERILVARDSPSKLVVLTLLDLGLLVASAVCLRLGPLAALIGSLGLVCWTVGLFALLYRVFVGGIALTLDSTGIRIRNDRHPILWSDIVQARVAEIRGTSFLCLWLAEPERYRASRGRLARSLAKANAGLGYGDVSVGVVGTNRSLDEICEYVRARIADVERER